MSDNGVFKTAPATQLLKLPQLLNSVPPPNVCVEPVAGISVVEEEEKVNYLCFVKKNINK